MGSALACVKCGNPSASDRVKSQFDGNCPWCVASFALGDPTPDTPSSTPRDALAGTFESVGKYVLTEKLGTGGMGEVWKALDSELNRWVALKFLKVEDPKELARFTREAHLAAKLSHPNIAAVHEIGRIGGRHYIVMPCIEGRTLETFPRNDRRLLVRLCMDAARALDHAHRQGVIHRDVKPANLMVEETEEGPKVVVLDFGLARPIEGGEKLSVSGSVVGTPLYLSPEQARAERLDERADVYSLGVTMYEIFTGRTPFEGKNVYEILKKIENEEPKAPREITPRISPDLQKIILKCLEKNREHRYAGAKELADDLRRFMNHEAVLARPPSAIYRLRMKLSQRKPVVAAVAAVLCLVAGAGILLPKMKAEARARERLAEYQKSYEAGRNAWDETQQLMRRAALERTLHKAREALGHFEAATGILEQADAHVMRGRCLQLVGRPRDAEEAWERALALDPDNQEARFHLAKLLLLEYLDGRDQGVVLGAGRTGGASRRISLGPETAAILAFRRRAEKHLTAVGGGEKAAYIRGVREVCQARHKEGAEFLAEYNQEGWDTKSIDLEGLARLYSGDFDGAIRACTRAIELDPKDVRAFLVRGLAKEAQGLSQEAVEDFDRVIALEKSFAGAYANRGSAYQNLGRQAEAIASYEEALRLDPNCVAALANLGRLKSDLGQHDAAIAHLTKARDLDPTNRVIWSNRSHAWHAKGEFSKAVEDLDRAIELDRNDPQAYCNRGVSKSEKGDLEGALEDLDTSLTLDSNYAVGYFNRGVVRQAKTSYDLAIEDYTRATDLDPKFAMAFNNRGNVKVLKGQTEAAILDYELAIKADPQYAMAHFNRGFMMQGKRLFEAALKDYDASIALNSKFPSAYFNRGGVRQSLGLPDAALEDFARAVELDPNSVKYRVQLGCAKQDKCLLVEAIAEFDAALKLDPNHVKALIQRGIATQNRGFPEPAIEDFTRAIMLDPKNAPAYTNRGIAKAGLGQFEEAIKDLDKGVEHDPKSSWALSFRGSAKQALGRHDEAIVDYDEAIKWDQKCHRAYAGRGYLRYRNGLHKEAIEDLTKAIELNPQDLASLNNRGNSYGALRRFDEEIADYSEFLKRDPRNTTVLFNRGIARMAKGLLEDAIRDFDAVIALRPSVEAYVYRGDAKTDMKLFKEAIADYNEALHLDPKCIEAISNRGIAKWRSGDVESAVVDWKESLLLTPPEDPYRAVLEELISTRGNRLSIEDAHRLHGQGKYKEAIEKHRAFFNAYPNALSAASCAYGIACAYALLGEKKNALDWLEKTVRLGWKDLAHLEKDADLDSLRSEERFKKLAAQLGAK